MVRRLGFTLVELLVAAVVLGILMATVSVFFARQTRVAGAAQAQNEAEMTARVVAEAIAQDFQLAGARATVVGADVDYEDIDIGGCDEKSRSRCVRAEFVDSAGQISAPLPVTDPNYEINAYAIFYRSSIGPTTSTLCRRVDFALVEGTLYRSDVECDLGLAQIDLDASIFATNVDEFSVSFECSDGVVYIDPLDCYVDSSGDVTEAYVRQANVSVDVALMGRFATEASMALTASTPNLRPSVNYGRFE